MKLFFITAIFSLVIISCNTMGVYEKTVFFPQHTWKSTDTTSFNFTIEDTAALYNLYIILRHQDAYGFKNIWLNIHVKDSDSSYTIKREFQLADNKHWLGSEMDDIVEHRLNFNATPTKLKKGNYTFTLQQAMREDPLQHVLNAGIRVEKQQ
ncbi:MAG: gliding motility lipoprotein GldH [Bacteroidetes bacterium]|nr:gliding motility lipoprotein GldH [Bacteroidota bacterium]MBS1640901.1 gliding motility lipoprotein GldH [Bacteroidota bacterium]MBS1669967.1 gliding motility lipoprotein GldH [Bacteroidota bacterium]